MSEPRIKVKRSVFGGYFWRCKQPGVVKCTPSVLGMSGRADTIAAAADAGRRHLAAFHAEGYSRRCGVRVASCAATECVCAELDADTVGVPEKPVQRFGPCECGTYPDPGICHCKGLGNSHCACSHDNPLQTTHNESREGC